MAVISGPDRFRRTVARPRRRAGEAWLLAGSALLLLWPALDNGFPLIFSDTGTYISQAMELHLGWDRPPFYSFLLLALDWGRTLWPPVIAQCFCTAWLVRRTQSMVFPESGGIAGAVAMALLAGATALPWTAAQVMPDIFTSIMVLALAIMVLDDDCTWLERGALMAVIALAIAVHLSNPPIYAGLCLTVLVPRAVLFRSRVPWFGVLAPFAVGVAALIGANVVASGQMSLSPYGSTFLLARLLADGPARAVLSRDCPGAGWALCRYRRDLPRSADGFLWRAGSPLYRAGGPVRLIGQTDAIILRTMRDEPVTVARDAARDFVLQLTIFAPGSGLRPWRATAAATIRRDFAPAAVRALNGSLQARDELRVPLVMLVVDRGGALLGLAITAGFVGVSAAEATLHRLRTGMWRLIDARLFTLSAIVLLALLGNAAVTGALSGPHARYQSRVVWLAVLTGALTLQRVYSARCSRPISTTT